jgi:hypothetical protein
MERQCTHVNCDHTGVGKVAETSGHWLCEQHLQAMKDAIEKWHKSGDVADMKKMLGITVRSAGGAERMTAQMFGEDQS